MPTGSPATPLLRLPSSGPHAGRCAGPRSVLARRGMLSLVLVGLLTLGGASAVLLASSGPARAGTCDEGGSLVSGDWTITTAQVCTGMLYTVDGSVTVGTGGSFTLIDGGLSFAKDAA